jgi:hypothetical protein
VRAFTRWVLVLSVLLLVAGCEQRTDQTDSGGVLLEVEFVNFPLRVAVNSSSAIQVETTEINSVIANPNRPTSALMDVELETFEVVYSRADGGTRVPTPYVINLLGTVPVGGTLSYTNLPVMSLEQLNNPPMTDLFFENGGFDKETGKPYIILNLEVRVFGRTLTGDTVASVPRLQTLEFVP